ncbi:hypothetical protein PRZ48_013631 [Zasmidium cellare]|uniref:Uncharacterized protein n=1 Tax=Zasmidium cellare TaxID=395010 RepID=A0ABR0E1K4_ZASCE|nr:hypothetical protein PRZ48_013631 [Zasmidium cellare]
MAPTQSTGLFKLPAEVRAVIWKHALVQDKPVRILDQPRQPGISRTCSQLREETLPMFYHANSFVVDNLHYECNYQHRFQSPAFCTFPTCSSQRIRPADWIEAVGYKYLRYVTKLHIKESTAGWLSAFDLRLEQNVKNQVLRHLPGSYWRAWFSHPDGGALYWSGYRDVHYLSELLQEIIDRLLQPGLSPKAIQELARNLTTDFGITNLMQTMGSEEKELVGSVLCCEVRALMTGSDSNVRSWVHAKSAKEGRDNVEFRNKLYNTILLLRSRFQQLKDDV